jgi:hypothetical protein
VAKVVIDNFSQMIGQAKKVPQVEGKVYSRMQPRDAKPYTMPYIIVQQISARTGNFDGQGQIDAFFTYSVDIYAETERKIRNIADSLTSLYMDIGIPLTSQISGDHVPTANGFRMNQTYNFNLDRHGIVTST